MKALDGDDRARARRPRSFDPLALYKNLQRARDKAFSVAIGSSFRSFGSHTVVQPPVRVHGWERISLGSEVFIGAHCWMAALDHEALEGSTIEIGSGTKIAGLCVISAVLQVRLGRSVLLGRNVYIADHKHAFTDVTRPVLDQGVDGVMAVEICDGAWLGNNTVIAPGVRIGCGAVVGANSVVKQDVPDFSVAVGAPARIVKTLSGTDGVSTAP